MSFEAIINSDDLDAIEKIAMQKSNLGSCISNNDFELIKVSEVLAVTVNKEADDMLGILALNLFPQAQHDEVKTAFSTLLRNLDGTYCHSLSLKTRLGKNVPVYAMHRRVDYQNKIYISSNFLHLPNELQFGDNFSDTEIFQQLIVDSDVDLVYIKNSKSDIVFANNCYKLLFPHGQRKESAKVNIESRNNDMIAITQGHLETRETLKLANDEEIIVQARRTRFTKSNGEQFMVCIAKDITEQETLITQLKRSNEDLGQFAYIASHDLRSPLNAIEKLVTWIEDDGVGTLPESSQKYFSLIKQRVSRLMNLLDDLLSFAKIGISEYQLEWINLERLAANIKSIMDPSGRFEIEAPNKDLFLPQVPFELAIRNLISNSIKHHHKEQGVIRIEYEEQFPDHVIKVIDDGPGIAPEMHTKAMEIFQTLKPRDDVEGSGMGLALIKRIMDLHGGSVAIDSDGESGTTIITRWNISDH